MYVVVFLYFYVIYGVFCLVHIYIRESVVQLTNMRFATDSFPCQKSPLGFNVKKIDSWSCSRLRLGMMQCGYGDDHRNVGAVDYIGSFANTKN